MLSHILLNQKGPSFGFVRCQHESKHGHEVIRVFCFQLDTELATTYYKSEMTPTFAVFCDTRNSFMTPVVVAVNRML